MAIKALPLQQTGDRNDALRNTQQLTALNPILKNPLMGGRILTGVALSSGDNTISHGLGRVLQGWIVVRLRGSATLYDKQDANSNASTTLVINSSAGVTADLYVF